MNNIVKDGCFLLIIRDSAIELAGYTAQRHDRAAGEQRTHQ